MPGKQSKQNYKKHNKKNQKNLTIVDNNIEKKNNNNVNSENTIANKVINITLAGFCAICWKNALYYCTSCHMVGYCCLSHMANHWLNHQKFCTAINKIVELTGFLYGDKIHNPEEWRYLRIKALENIKIILQRNLEPYERDLVLFPKHCSTCYEITNKKLQACKYCRQVWYCLNKPEHLPKNHSEWCNKLQLFSNLVRKQAEGKLFMYDMNFGMNISYLELKTSDNINKAIKLVVKDVKDECQIAMISQAASGPLTMLYALRIAKFKIKKSLVIHLIGAELHYEGRTLQAWENFFMHFITEITNLKIVMVGPELNAITTGESLRLCEECSKKNKTLQFEYKDGLLYHEYASKKYFMKPDIVCAFNPGLHRSTGFNQNDTWPQTIYSAVSNKCPFIFTAYTSYEAPRDLERVQKSASVHIIQSPILNPFASLKPDRNFISDHKAPLIFKNYYLSIVTSV